MFTCVRDRKRLGAYLDGELSGRDRASVERHLEVCDQCRAVLSGLKELEPLLVAHEAPPVPLGLTARVMAAARHRRHGQATAVWNPLRWWRMASAPMRWASVATPVAGLIAGLVLGWTSGGPIARSTTAEQADALDVYQLDYLGDLPAGSLADSYMDLVLAANEGGR